MKQMYDITIITSGQTGVDQAALYAAQKVGFNTGGFMPKGWLTLDGPRPEFEAQFGMEENNNKSYKKCISDNIETSDFTLQLARDFSTYDQRYVSSALKKYGKPYIDIHDTKLLQNSEFINILTAQIIALITENHIFKKIIINVAGNSEFTAPGIYEITEKFFFKIFSKIKELLTI